MNNARIREKVKPVQGFCVIMAYDCGGKWREVKQKWFVGVKL